MTSNQTAAGRAHDAPTSQLSKHADFVDDFCNQRYYEALLQAIEKSVAQLNLEFGPSSGYTITKEDIELLAAGLSDARLTYLNPMLDPEDVKRIRSQELEDGYAQTWLLSILEALQMRGLFLKKAPQSDR